MEGSPWEGRIVEIGCHVEIAYNERWEEMNQ